MIGLAGCASVPFIDHLQPAAAETTPRLEGSRGPLTEKASKAILARVGQQSGAPGLLERHLAIEQAVAETPLVAGNSVRILRDGEQTFPAIFKAIAEAKHHINMEYYILEDVESDGMRLSDLLLQKRAAGVAVNIIYDSVGSIGTPLEFFQRLQAAGVQMLDFHPLTPLALFGRYSPNDRDHRKILVTDGRLAIVGGINLSTTYQSKRDRDGSGTPPLKWRDTDLEITGPVVRQLQSLFLDQWHKHHGAPLLDADFFPTVPPTGDEVVRIIGSTPEHAVPRYYVTLLSAIRTAEKSIWLSAGYFVPTHQEMEDLTAAARRGVDVRLMLPSKSDSDRALAVGHSHYEDLLEAGVKIYESQDAILHSKMTVVDHVWSVVGSSNFDARSVIFNDEVDAVVLGIATASALEAVFEADRRTARQIDAETWDDRPWSDRLDEFFSRFIEVLL